MKESEPNRICIIFLSLKSRISTIYYRPSFFIVFLISYVLFLSFIPHSDAQIRKPKSYALVIGVSKYNDPRISSLNYAHNDAEAFARFCSSPLGLNIPAEQMKVLTNEEASYWNIMDGLDWLKSEAKKDDQIYFYFAGHGDMESPELKFGYLLTYDSRYMNYLGRSLSLDLLNKTAHTLSVIKKAKVFLLTDACHSGKLAGVDFNGSNLVALNLMQLVSANEVRITSCNEGELSYEDELWGNGRGAFSYFLTRGMAGEADGVTDKKDGNISISELKSYLALNVPQEVKKVKRAKQNPVVMGNESVQFNSFKPGIELLFNNTSTGDNVSNPDGARSVTLSSQDDIFLKDIESEVMIKIREPGTDFTQLSGKKPKEIREFFLKDMMKESDYSKKKLSSPSAELQIAKTLHDNVQKVIDLYLMGDEAELEKRRYYSQVAKPYDQYPDMILTAISLLPNDHYLISSLQMLREYMTGLNYRLKIPFSDNPDDLVDNALKHQLKALEMYPEAAYIHNELGILYRFKKDNEKARFHFEKAHSISPLWSLPISNLAHLYYFIEDYDTSKKYVDMAFDMQSSLQNPYIIDGNLYMKEDHLLFAEEQYQKAIKLNSRHFMPFEKLGELYLKVQDYESANEYYYEAELRKMGLNFRYTLDLSDGDGVMDFLDTNNFFIDTSDVKKDDIVAHFAVGKWYFDERDYETAQSWFERVIRLDVKNPLVYHYIGQTAYYFRDYDRAEYYFKLALDFHLDKKDFRRHINLLSQNPSTLSGAFDTYKTSNYDIYDTHIYLARTYEKWGNYVSASEKYNTCIELDPEKKVAYYMLWNMYKSRKELELAEGTIHRFGRYYPDDWENVLADYYNWVINNFEDDVHITENYAYKYGILMYQYMMNRPGDNFGESLKPEPDKEDKDFVNFEYERIDMIIFNGDSARLSDVVKYSEPLIIEYPLSTGVRMFKKVVSLSADNHIRSDAFAKMGDIYFRAESNTRALENYEKSLDIKGDNIGLRSKAIYCADQLYLFKKSWNHLNILKNNNGLNFDDAILLARYYMKAGQRDSSLVLSEKLAQTHPFLKEKVQMDVIITHLRFEEFEKAAELLQLYYADNSPDYLTEYMLARAYAGMKQPDLALKHLISADNLGFRLGFVFSHDSVFDTFRTQAEWSPLVLKMTQYREQMLSAN